MDAELEVNTPETQEEDFSKHLTEDGGLDVESLVEDYKDIGAEEEITPNGEEKRQEDTETETVPDNSEKGEGGPASTEEEPEAQLNQDPEEETEKRTPDAAFAEMRRRAEQNESLANWVQELATKQGFQDPQQLIEEFNKQQLAKEAQEKGVPLDVYERLQQLELENKTKDDRLFEERFNAEVAETKEKTKKSITKKSESNESQNPLF